jgi:hypothetical protein
MPEFTLSDEAVFRDQIDSVNSVEIISTEKSGSGRPVARLMVTLTAGANFNCGLTSVMLHRLPQTDWDVENLELLAVQKLDLNYEPVPCSASFQWGKFKIPLVVLGDDSESLTRTYNIIMAPLDEIKRDPVTITVTHAAKDGWSVKTKGLSN